MWVGIIAIKTEGTQIHFLSDALVAVESLDLTSVAETGLLRGRSQVQTPAGPTLEELRRNWCPCNDICERLDFLVFSDNDEKPLVPSHSTLSFTILFLRDVKEPTPLFEKSRGRRPRWCGQPLGLLGYKSHYPPSGAVMAEQCNSM